MAPGMYGPMGAVGRSGRSGAQHAEVSEADKMITLGKRDTLHSRRQAAAFLETPQSLKKLFDTLGTRFGQRQGGYTRIVRLGFRKGDGAEQAMIELVGSELVKRAAERAQRREERLKAQREGREEEGEE